MIHILGEVGYLEEAGYIKYPSTLRPRLNFHVQSKIGFMCVMHPTAFGVHYESEQNSTFLDQPKLLKSVLGPLRLVMHLGECIMENEWGTWDTYAQLPPHTLPSFPIIQCHKCITSTLNSVVLHMWQPKCT